MISVSHAIEHGLLVVNSMLVTVNTLGTDRENALIPLAQYVATDYLARMGGSSTKGTLVESAPQAQRALRLRELARLVEEQTLNSLALPTMSKLKSRLGKLEEEHHVAVNELPASDPMLPHFSKLGEVLRALHEVLEGFDQARSRYWTIRIFCQSPRDLRLSLSARYSIEIDAERAGNPHPDARYSVEESERHARTQGSNQNLDKMIESDAEKMDLMAYMHSHPDDVTALLQAELESAKVAYIEAFTQAMHDGSEENDAKALRQMRNLILKKDSLESLDNSSEAMRLMRPALRKHWMTCKNCTHPMWAQWPAEED